MRETEKERGIELTEREKRRRQDITCGGVMTGLLCQVYCRAPGGGQQERCNRHSETVREARRGDKCRDSFDILTVYSQARLETRR